MKRSKQPRELTDEERTVVVAVRHCAGELNDILQGSRRKAQSNGKLFAQSGVSVLYRGLNSYANMYEKLQVKSREGVDRLFTKFSECEEIQDTQDAIDETEGNWRDFLRNLDKEVSHGETSRTRSDSPKANTSIDDSYFITSHFPLIDLQTNKEVTLGDYVVQNTSLFVTFQPAYWSDTCVRWRHAEVNKVKADLSQFNVGFVVVTWGPSELVRSWAKQLHRVVKWPVLWDKSNTICSHFGFRSGLDHVWRTANLDFLGCQKTMFNRAANPPPTDFDWLQWRQIGGEAVISRPVIWDSKLIQTKPTMPTKHEKVEPGLKRPSQSVATAERGESTDEESSPEHDLECQSERDRRALQSGKTKICLLYRSEYIADLLPSGAIYQAALTAYARAANTTEAMVMDRIRQNRRLATAPESARLQYEATTGLYYDPETALYYDSTRGYFYDSRGQGYYYWSEAEHRYIPANALIQAELAATQAAQAVVAEAEKSRLVTEREAAQQAAQQVVAQLAEIRASKDDYAAYAYATCVIPQQEKINYNRPPVYRNTAAGANQIEASMRSWDARVTNSLVPYGEDNLDADYRSGTPPPPGL